MKKIRFNEIEVSNAIALLRDAGILSDDGLSGKVEDRASVNAAILSYLSDGEFHSYHAIMKNTSYEFSTVMWALFRMKQAGIVGQETDTGVEKSLNSSYIKDGAAYRFNRAKNTWQELDDNTGEWHDTPEPAMTERVYTRQVFRMK